MNDADSTGNFIAGFLTCGLIVGIAGMIAYHTIPEFVTKDEAVASGHAEYYLDSKNARQWRWKPMPTPEPAK